jgi:hypothetical protein
MQLVFFFPFFQAQYYDGNISLPGCDKNMPGCAMAAVRHNRPTIIVYGGTILTGERHVDCPAMGYKKGDPVNISDAFESYGESQRCGGNCDILGLLLTVFRKVHSLLVRSRRNSASTLSDTRVLDLGPVAGCTRASLQLYQFVSALVRWARECTTVPSDRANTMSSVLEVLGLSLPYSSSTPATFDGAFIRCQVLDFDGLTIQRKTQGV